MNNLNPLVSVIIPTYNRANIITETVYSVISQTYSTLEIIIIDDGSMDTTNRVVSKIKDSRVRYIYTKNWGGPARARNIGVKLSHGEYIAFLDSDDLWPPEKIEKQMQCFQNDVKVDLVYSDSVIFNANHERKFYRQHKYQYNPFYYFIHSEFTFPLSSVMIKKISLDPNDLFPEVKELIAVEDYCLWIKLSKKMKFKKCKNTSILYRLDNNDKISAVSSKSRVYQMKGYYRCAEAFEYLLRNKIISERDYKIALFRLSISLMFNLKSNLSKIDYKQFVKKYSLSENRIPLMKRISITYNVLNDKIIRNTKYRWHTI